MRVSPPQCIAKYPVLGVLPTWEIPSFPTFAAPEKQRTGAPTSPLGSLQALQGAGQQQQHLSIALQPSSAAAPLVSPQEKHHLGLQCSRGDAVWKERRICFNLRRAGLQPKYTGRLWARLYPGPQPGDGLNPPPWFQGSSCRVSKLEGADGKAPAASMLPPPSSGGGTSRG